MKKSKKRFILIVFSLIMILVLMPVGALANSKVSGDVTLNFPNSYVSCEPADKITTTGVPVDVAVDYYFFEAIDGSQAQIGSGSTTGNLSVDFPYPDLEPGEFVFAVRVDVHLDSGTVKLAGKWKVTCEEKTPPPPTETPKPSETPPPTKTPPPTETPPPPTETPKPTKTPPTPTEPPPGNEGCTPGFWRQAHHYDSWTGFIPGQQFSSVFEDAFPDMSLGTVVQLGGGGLNALGRHTVAALLNAASPDVDYPYSVNGVITMFNDVYPGGDYESLKNTFEMYNEAGCPLN